MKHFICENVNSQVMRIDKKKTTTFFDRNEETQLTRCTSATRTLTVQVHEPGGGVTVPPVGPEIAVVVSVLAVICDNEVKT